MKSEGQKWIGDKISKLEAENKDRPKKRPHAQIIAIALDKAREKGYPVKKKAED